MPQACLYPADTVKKAAEGGEAWPKSLRPQQTAEWSLARSAQENLAGPNPKDYPQCPSTVSVLVGRVALLKQTTEKKKSGANLF